jgi:hypothetical protein
MLRRLYPCVIKKRFPTIHQQEYFDPKGRKNINQLADWSTRLGMLRRPVSLRNKRKDFQPSTSKNNISTLRVENINQLVQTDLDWGCWCRPYPCVIKKKDFQPSTSKNISTLRVENIIQLGQTRLDWECCVDCTLRNKEKDFQTIHQQEGLDP